MIILTNYVKLKTLRHVLEETKMIKKLIEGIKRTKAPIVVGLDPMLSYIPDTIKDEVFREQLKRLDALSKDECEEMKAVVAEIVPTYHPELGAQK